ncbi:unnamed protein product [Mycetohabitans rhizoxinica HKI 454]|uniref:Uncharacterized protein n=1 Tax=Mycetohabitans rhizoxinica (strain DSM 19002 / CIP 109453 / HKI 454) TaxID=882378 RepID=E5ARE0_MYCRK|nr:unnamed protein product [Mycetohabitans rhizoxinica HKI 454]
MIRGASTSLWIPLHSGQRLRIDITLSAKSVEIAAY